ncbi:MAG: peptide ABC transporter substrate-binding protein [Megasphaera sp.]|nr:peptide ABC transporter substrate-binding protein [Megasphaera sp.]
MGILSWVCKKRSLFLGVSMILCIFMFSGCANHGETKKNNKGTLYIGMTNAPDSFNPLFNPGIAGRFAIRFMYDTLLGMPEPNEFTPQLAESINTEDNQNFIIKLNPNAKWTDGQPVTAQDVVYTFNLIANPTVETTKGTYIKMLEGLDDKGQLAAGNQIPDLIAKDEHTVAFKTKVPVDPNYIKSMLGFEVYIIPKHVFENIQPETISNSEAVKNPMVTSGPFKFVKYATNDYVEYAANTDYYKGTPKLKKIFLRIMNGTNLVTELKSGNIQMAAGGSIGIVPVKDLEILQNDKKLVVKSAPSNSVQFLEVNNSNPMFNVKFRRAITMAINREKIIDQLYKGNAHMVPTLYTSISPVYNKNLQPLRYDPVKAKQELAESGFDISKELTLQVPLGNVLREQSADLIQQDLKGIGINVKQQKLDFPTVLSNGRKGNYELMLMSYVPSVEPDYSAYFTPGNSSNYSQTNDPKLTDMFVKALAMTSLTERRMAYSAIQEFLNEQQFLTTLCAPDDIIAQSKELNGGIKDFWEGSLDDLHEWSLK